MKRTFLKQLFCLSCCAVLALSASSVFAAENPDSPSSVIHPEQTGTVIIDYQDTVDSRDPIVDAGFTFYKIADFSMQITAGEASDLSTDNGQKNTDMDSGFETDTLPSAGNQYVPVIPDLTIDQNTEAADIAEKVQTYYKEHPETAESYTGKTGSDGKLAITGMALGVYLGIETSPAKEHYASAPFLFQLPYSDGEGTERTFWNYKLTVEPKSLPAGSLAVSKQVTGTAGDTTQTFHFKIEFKTADESLSVPYEISGGKKGSIRSGETIPLKSGETVTIAMIPCGSDYKVTEIEADQNGYKTTAAGTSGHIIRKSQTQVKFVNHKDKTPKTTEGPQTGDNLPIEYAALAAVSVCIIGTALLISHRRKKK